MRALETQVTELEAETAKLLLAFEGQKALTAEAGSLAKRKAEEVTSHLSVKVRERIYFQVVPRSDDTINSSECGDRFPKEKTQAILRL